LISVSVTPGDGPGPPWAGSLAGVPPVVAGIVAEDVAGAPPPVPA
jgi:hypothetical protein